jgi:hypothetical protein
MEASFKILFTIRGSYTHESLSVQCDGTFHWPLSGQLLEHLRAGALIRRHFYYNCHILWTES